MKTRRSAAAACVACAVWAPAAALAQGPAFDCGKAKGEVEALICGDASLAALDRRLGEVFAAAMAKARGKLASRLREEQRGWVKGRNDCWKAKTRTWITASWTVDTVKDCVDAQYRIRTAEIQAVWRLVPPRTVFYACRNDPANEVVANFFATDPATIRLERGDRTVTLWRVGTGGGDRYEGQNVSLGATAGGLDLRWLDTNTGRTDELQCREK